MRVLDDFLCGECGHKWEKFTRIEQKSDACPICGGVANRVLTPPRIKLDGTDPAFSTAYDRWAKVHEDAARRAYKRDDIGGQFHGDN